MVITEPDKSYVDSSAKQDQIDFTVGGIDYRSGAFVISEDYAGLAQVDSIIDAWVMGYSGLTVRYGQPAFKAPVHEILTSLPRAALDEANWDLAVEAFFERA